MQSRIIFANRIDLMSDHLARIGLADLFLDTFPYNAHTTAVDSLKAGVPLVTLLGKSFAGRVAASLLGAVGLSDLIATTSAQYEQIAYELFKDKEKLLQYKKMLLEARLNEVLFNSEEFSKNIEASYLMMYKRYHDGLSPEHMKVAK
jgi:predicted O-linked N-acetylglucosamine transferase (SPINDLY family)